MDRDLIEAIRHAVAPWHSSRLAKPNTCWVHGTNSDTNARDAAQEAAVRLNDGMWHTAMELGGIAKRHKASVMGMYQVLDGFGLAQSDSGHYLCIPTDWTPELAPDGT